MLGMLGGFLGNLFFKREGGGEATPGEAVMVSTSLGRGAPLESGVRGRMENAFGYDFSRVRIHSGETAAGVSATLGARAFTFGGDIGFAAGEYQPNTLIGDALIAHELAHVVQQSGGGGGTTGEVEEDADHSAVGAVMALWGGAKKVARSAMPRLRSGLRLQRCTTPKKPAVAAPVKPTQVVSEPPQLVDKVPAPVAACHGRPDERACQHEKYVTTVLPQAIKNIRAVKTPYSEAIASTYESALPAAQKAPPPPEGMGTSPAEGGPVTVTFAGTTHTFTKFVISLQNFWGGANGQAFGAGGTIAYIMLNEGSENALRGELPPIEETMVHEMIHVFDQIVTAQNAGRAAGTPARNVNLDVTTYAGVQTRLEAALLPFVQQIQQLPGFASNKPKETPELNASSTATSFISETIARTEAGIYAKRRGGGTFTAADFPTFLGHMHNANYWSPRPPDLKELSDWLKAHEAEINEKIAPLVDEAAALYLKERPSK